MYFPIVKGPGTTRMLDAVLCQQGNVANPQQTIKPLELTFTVTDFWERETPFQVKVRLTGQVKRLSDMRVSKWRELPGYEFRATLIQDDGSEVSSRVEYWLNGTSWDEDPTFRGSIDTRD